MLYEVITISTGNFLIGAEWFFTLLFSIEYLLRIYCVRKRREYALSFFGVVDFISIIPTYLSVVFPSTKYFMVLRTLRP